MVTFTHILYPTDLSSAAAPAFGYAVSLARWYQATLTVLHVAPTFDAIPVPPGAIGELEHILYPPSRDMVMDELRRTLGADTLSDVKIEFLVEEGDAASIILDRSLSLGANLVVMGTHGRRGFDRLLHGSVTERVLQRSACPVMTIPPHAAAAPNDPIFTRILCPIDFSPSSQQAYGFALDLASQSNGAVTALHVLESLAEEDLTAYAGIDLALLRHDLASKAEARLAEFADAEPHDWCEVTPAVRSGRSHREILKAATEISANLIVIGAHGHGGLGSALFGATTHQVIRSAGCPVLVVRTFLASNAYW